MITASQLGRLLACPSSAVLARAETHSVWAQAGREEHEDLAHLDGLPDELKRHVPPGARSEVRLAYDVATREGRIIGEGGGRAYGEPGPYEIVGSTDVLAVVGEAVLILDWKGGNEVEAAASNPQLLFYAIAACRALSLDSAILRIVYTRTGRVDEATIGPLELADFANRLYEIHATIARRTVQHREGIPVDTVEGSHCLYCPSKHVCPSKNALLVQFASSGSEPPGASLLSPELAAKAYRQVCAVDQLVSEAKKRLAAYVDEHGPIDLGNGLMYGRYTRKGNEELDADRVVDAIYNLLPEADAEAFEDLAIERSTTKAAIKRAAQKLAANGGASKLADSIVRRTRELGGATHKPTTRPLGEYKRDDDGNRAPAPTVADINAMLGARP